MPAILRAKLATPVAIVGIGSLRSRR